MRCSWPCRDMGSGDGRRPRAFRIRVWGALPESRPDRLENMDIMTEWREDREPVTVLQGSAADEVDLPVVLGTLYELRRTLLSVEAIE